MLTEYFVMTYFPVDARLIILVIIMITTLQHIKSSSSYYCVLIMRYKSWSQKSCQEITSNKSPSSCTIHGVMAVLEGQNTTLS